MFVNGGYKLKELTDFISAVGFPIVVSFAMFYQNTVLSQTYQKITQELSSKIENNTLVMTKLLDQLNQDGILKGGETK